MDKRTELARQIYALSPDVKGWNGDAYPLSEAEAFAGSHALLAYKAADNIIAAGLVGETVEDVEIIDTYILPTLAFPLKTFDLYCELGRKVDVCSHGCEHEVFYFDATTVSVLAETREYDNDFEKLQTLLAVDNAGQVYHQHLSVDYSHNETWFRDNDEKSIRYVKNHYRELARASDGTPLNGTTPLGLPF